MANDNIDKIKNLIINECFLLTKELNYNKIKIEYMYTRTLQDKGKINILPLAT